MPGVWTLYSGFLSVIDPRRTDKNIIFLGIGLHVPRCSAFGPYGVAVDHFLTWSKVPSSAQELCESQRRSWRDEELHFCNMMLMLVFIAIFKTRLSVLLPQIQSPCPVVVVGCIIIKAEEAGWSSIDSFRGSSFNSGLLLLKSSRVACKRCFFGR